MKVDPRLISFDNWPCALCGRQPGLFGWWHFLVRAHKPKRAVRVNAAWRFVAVDGTLGVLLSNRPRD